MLYVLAPTDWLESENPNCTIKQLDTSFSEALDFNRKGYNVYYYPNYPSKPGDTFVKGSDVDVFEWVFVDMDLKDRVYGTKEEFIDKLGRFNLLPRRIVDSGGGIHAYWRISDLDAKSYLRLQRRIMRLFNTDPATTMLKQLMRCPGTVNPKIKGTPRDCIALLEEPGAYTCEQMSKELPPITLEDEKFCTDHYNNTHNVAPEVKVNEDLPFKFTKLLRSSQEAKELYLGDHDDRSIADYRLAHLLSAEGFTRDEALSVLVNCKKALERSPTHRTSYAVNIVDKIWEFEAAPDKAVVNLSSSVRDILQRGSAIKGQRFRCWDMFDGTEAGFQLTQVLGLIGGAGSGKTTLALNYFYWFAKLNPDYIHVFVSLEQPEEEIALRWATIAAQQESLHDKVHVLGNYNPDGTYRNLSLSEIEDYLVQLEQRLKVKVGCVVIDHVGVLKKKGKAEESQNLIDIFHNMKAFAKRTNTFLIMQSQTSREKAGIGDLELNKDAAYGSGLFEWYCDFIVTTHQPLKRVYSQSPEMTVSAYKYCKIRKKNVRLDRIKEDDLYILMFDPSTEMLREMTQTEYERYEFLNKTATTLRNKDRKREPTKITKLQPPGSANGTTTNNQE